MDTAIDKNMIDKDEYPQTAEIEIRCVHMLADLWNAPHAANTIGCSTTGSSEACMLAGMAAKWRWRAKRQAAGKPTDKPNMVCGPVQVCWHKFARYWDVEHARDPDGAGRSSWTPEAMLERGRREHHRGRAHLGRDLHGAIRAGRGRCPTPSTSCKSEPGSTSTSMSMAPAAAFLAPFIAPDWSGIFGCRG